MEPDNKVAQMPNPNEFALDACEMEILNRVQAAANLLLSQAQARAEGMLQGVLESAVHRNGLQGQWSMMPDRPGVLVKR